MTDDDYEAKAKGELDRIAGLFRTLVGERPYQYILSGHTPVPCTDIREWSAWLSDRAKRVVAQEYVGDYWVSTVFLGLDHNFTAGAPPLLFETMVFIGRKSADASGPVRYATWAEAAAGHAHVCAALAESG